MIKTIMKTQMKIARARDMEEITVVRALLFVVVGFQPKGSESRMSGVGIAVEVDVCVDDAALEVPEVG
jgi:hypothetical protein